MGGKISQELGLSGSREGKLLPKLNFRCYPPYDIVTLIQREAAHKLNPHGQAEPGVETMDVSVMSPVALANNKLWNNGHAGLAYAAVYDPTKLGPPVKPAVCPVGNFVLPANVNYSLRHRKFVISAADQSRKVGELSLCDILCHMEDERFVNCVDSYETKFNVHYPVTKWSYYGRPIWPAYTNEVVANVNAAEPQPMTEQQKMAKVDAREAAERAAVVIQGAYCAADRGAFTWNEYAELGKKAAAGFSPNAIDWYYAPDVKDPYEILDRLNKGTNLQISPMEWMDTLRHFYVSPPGQQSFPVLKAVQNAPKTLSLTDAIYLSRHEQLNVLPVKRAEQERKEQERAEQERAEQESKKIK
jgi:hypothetical protein